MRQKGLMYDDEKEEFIFLVLSYMKEAPMEDYLARLEWAINKAKIETSTGPQGPIEEEIDGQTDSTPRSPRQNQFRVSEEIWGPSTDSDAGEGHSQLSALFNRNS